MNQFEQIATPDHTEAKCVPAERLEWESKNGWRIAATFTQMVHEEVGYGKDVYVDLERRFFLLIRTSDKAIDEAVQKQGESETKYRTLWAQHDDLKKAHVKLEESSARNAEIIAGQEARLGMMNKMERHVAAIRKELGASRMKQITDDADVVAELEGSPF